MANSLQAGSGASFELAVADFAAPGPVELRRGERILELFRGMTPLGGCVVGVADVTEQRRTAGAIRRQETLDTVGQLTGGVAHSFNNLLTTVIGSLELARDHADTTPTLRRWLDSAQAGAERGARLTRQLLSVGRRDMLRPQAFVAADVLEGMRELVESVVDS